MARTHATVPLAVGPLAISLRPRKLVIARRDRPELPHLTLSWDNASDEIDLHLTDASKAKTHRPLLRVASSAAMGLVERLAVQMRADVLQSRWPVARRVRPGWLGRSGYSICIVQEDAILEWVRRLAPKSRQKYRLDLAPLSDPRPFGFVQFYRPAILHYLAASRAEYPFVAQCVGHHRRHKILLLSYTMDSDGRLGWMACPFGSFANQQLPRRVARALSAELRSRVACEILEKVVDALRLGEIEALNGLVAEIRKGLDPARQS